KMIAMEEKAAREALAVKAAKEAEEALRKQSEAISSFGERVSQFMENPLQGAKGAISSVLSPFRREGHGIESWRIPVERQRKLRRHQPGQEEGGSRRQNREYQSAVRSHARALQRK